VYPPIYPAVASSPACVALLKSGTGPIRFYQFGINEEQPQTYPYAVWQRVGGLPENYLGQTPDIDSFTVQVDVYAKSADQARTVATALRDAIEPVAHVTGWFGESRDPDTKNYRFTFQTDWWTPRP
jgi:hypothetical protein